MENYFPLIAFKVVVCEDTVSAIAFIKQHICLDAHFNYLAFHRTYLSLMLIFGDVFQRAMHKCTYLKFNFVNIISVYGSKSFQRWVFANYMIHGIGIRDFCRKKNLHDTLNMYQLIISNLASILNIQRPGNKIASCDHFCDL